MDQTVILENKHKVYLKEFGYRLVWLTFGKIIGEHLIFKDDFCGVHARMEKCIYWYEDVKERNGFIGKLETVLDVLVYSCVARYLHDENQRLNKIPNFTSLALHYGLPLVCICHALGIKLRPKDL